MQRQTRCTPVGDGVLQGQTVRAECDILHDCRTADQVQVNTSYGRFGVWHLFKGLPDFFLNQSRDHDVGTQEQCYHDRDQRSHDPQCYLSGSFHDT